MDVKRIYRHLTEEIGFWEVGFAPVTTSPNRAHAISDGGYDEMLGQFRDAGVRVSGGHASPDAITASRT